MKLSSPRKARPTYPTDIRIPHSSWSRSRPEPSNEVVRPEDFWARLGV